MADRAGVEAALDELRGVKAYAKATHNSWGALLANGGPAKGDDGEAGAGAVIIDALEHAGLRGHVVIVTRWYGGKQLGGDRFRHVRACARAYIDEVAEAGPIDT